MHLITTSHCTSLGWAAELYQFQQNKYDLLVEPVVRSIHNDASHAPNRSQDRYNNADDDAEPRCPEMPLCDAGLLDS